MMQADFSVSHGRLLRNVSPVGRRLPATASRLASVLHRVLLPLGLMAGILYFTMPGYAATSLSFSRVNVRSQSRPLSRWVPARNSSLSLDAAELQENPQQNSQPGSDREQQTGSYSLPPDRAARAIAYARARHLLYFADFASSIIVLLLIIRTRIGPMFRDWAERAARNRFLQAAIFGTLLLLTLGVFSLPGEATSHWLARRYEQSIQGWGSWFWDWMKGELLGVAVGIVLVWLLYAVIRRSPRLWWFWVWAGSLPVLILFVFIAPLLIEPMFFRFTPLADTNAQLADQLERVVAHAGQNIPRNRMYVMNASSKLNQLNAYVTGVGASRRVVVWDTTISRMTTPEISFVFGHEMGHYVLGHIAAGIIFTAVLLLVSVLAGFYVINLLIQRFGRAWGVRGVDDWASLPVLLLILLLCSFLFTPIENAYSRHLEHQADQYGLEVVHGILPDAPRVAAQSFQILGDVDLEEPAPSWPVKVWFYSHPPIHERIAFANSYNPWAQGKSPEFVK